MDYGVPFSGKYLSRDVLISLYTSLVDLLRGFESTGLDYSVVETKTKNKKIWQSL